MLIPTSVILSDSEESLYSGAEQIPRTVSIFFQ